MKVTDLKTYDALVEVMGFWASSLSYWDPEVIEKLQALVDEVVGLIHSGEGALWTWRIKGDDK